MHPLKFTSEGAALSMARFRSSDPRQTLVVIERYEGRGRVFIVQQPDDGLFTSFGGREIARYDAGRLVSVDIKPVAIDAGSSAGGGA